MYNGIEKIEAVIDKIEKDITADVDYEALASDMALSVYEFRRIFAFIVGCPLSDYVRRRRLTLAACEIMNCRKVSIQKISEKYGYSTVSAFSKAFSEQHGISPSMCREGKTEIKLFSRPKFEITVLGGEEHSFRIIADGAFSIRGYSALSDYTDTCCCEGVWSAFYDGGHDGAVVGDEIYVSYSNCGSVVKCTIGERGDTESLGDVVNIPECRWLSVTMSTTDDDAVNKKYNSILYELLPSANLKRKADMPTLEVYPKDMESDNFKWEIRIPIE